MSRSRRKADTCRGAARGGSRPRHRRAAPSASSASPWPGSPGLHCAARGSRNAKVWVAARRGSGSPRQRAAAAGAMWARRQPRAAPGEAKLSVECASDGSEAGEGVKVVHVDPRPSRAEAMERTCGSTCAATSRVESGDGAGAGTRSGKLPAQARAKRQMARQQLRVAPGTAAPWHRAERSGSSSLGSPPRARSGVSSTTRSEAAEAVRADIRDGEGGAAASGACHGAGAQRTRAKQINDLRNK